MVFGRAKGKHMKRLLLLASLALVFGLADVHASGLCVNGSTYYDLVNNPCQVGSFFNVTFATMGTSGAVGGNNGNYFHILRIKNASTKAEAMIAQVIS